MAQEIKEIVRMKVNSLGYDYNILKPLVKKYLLKIETEILTLTTIRQECLNTFKKTKLNLSSIAQNTGIARKTLYNNDILKNTLKHLQYYLLNLLLHLS